jgi:hypothetical protein
VSGIVGSAVVLIFNKATPHDALSVLASCRGEVLRTSLAAGPRRSSHGA